jgi:hypothetical protein
MIQIDNSLTPKALLPALENLFEHSGRKIRAIQGRWDTSAGTPVFTEAGKYSNRAWTEWTQGFQFGSAVVQFEVTGDEEFLKIGRDNTLKVMAPHVSHIGVHDHGFNNVSTYGNLRRLMLEGKIPHNEWELNFYEMALKISGCVQAARWTQLSPDYGYIYSFNGPHSLFADTIRSLRALAISYQLGHVFQGEGDKKISLLGRIIQHARSTAKWTIFYGEGRDSYDLRGRTAHESIFNLNDGAFRCPNSQQGYSPFSTWTRGLAWCLVGFPEEIEFLQTLDESVFTEFGGKAAVLADFFKAAEATADFYLEHTPTDGIPYWDTGAPELWQLGDYLSKPAQIHNDFEPVDSSAAAIAAQGLVRLGKLLTEQGDAAKGQKYYQAGLTTAQTVLSEPYLSVDDNHEGLILHSIYHRPNGWDYIPAGSKIPLGESSMWGDYHARELGLLLWRLAKGESYYTFFNGGK